MRLTTYLFIVVGTVFFTLQYPAQTLILSGKVTDRATGQPLHSVNIAIENTQRGAVTDRDGYYKLKIKNQEEATVYYSYVGYETYNKTFKISRSDTLVFNVQLESETSELPTFEVTDLSEPDTIFGDNRINVLDFAFYRNKLVLLTYGSRPNKGGKVVLTDYNEKRIAEVEFEDEPIEIVVDYRKRIIIICENNIYLCKVNSNELKLIELPELMFRAQVMPCVDTLNEDILFTNQVEHLPYFDYMAWDRFTEKEELIKHITDAELERLFRFEYYYLNPREKLIARKFALQNKLDKHEVAAAMTGFHQSLYYTVPYAPMFLIDEEILIFDHYNDYLYKINPYYELTDSIKIAYHKEVKRTEWENQLLRDKENDKLYALFQKKGYYYVREINTETGKAGQAFKMTNKYVEKPKVNDDYIYYIYRPFGSLQSRFLYREQIKN